MPFEKKKNPKCQAAGGKGSRPRRGAHAAAAAVAERPPALESNNEGDVDCTDDPVGRRIDDVFTTAQTFNVAGLILARSQGAIAVARTSQISAAMQYSHT